jgi:hypothetical protein
VSTTSGTRGAAAWTRRTDSMPCESGKPGSSRTMSNVPATRWLSAAAIESTWLTSVSEEPSFLNISRSSRANPGSSSTRSRRLIDVCVMTP